MVVVDAVGAWTDGPAKRVAGLVQDANRGSPAPDAGLAVGVGR